MPGFISKIQHKNYEKGEFSDEQSRSLDDTINLIKTFPWDNERTLTDVQLTGPSITIQGEQVDYLKIGLYFNGKYCLYYLDKDNHLYEYHAADITEACKIVADFFAGQLDLKNFDKHFFNIGNKPHFLTSSFEYQITFKKIIRFVLPLGIPFFAVLIMILETTKESRQAALYVALFLFVLTIVFVLAYLSFGVFSGHDNYLQISKGNDSFSFGYTEKGIRSYEKKDVQKVITYISSSRGNRNGATGFKICFKNGESIKFSSFLISETALRRKFSNNMDDLYVPFEPEFKSFFSMI